MDDDINNDPLLERARIVLADGNDKYAMFLYREALKKCPDNLAIRAELHKLRKSVHPINTRSIFSLLKQLYIQIQILYQKRHKSPSWKILDSIESFIDCNPHHFDGYRMLAAAATNAKIYTLAEFSINEIPEEERTRDDLLTIAVSLLEQKKFDQSLKIANALLEKFPEDIEIQDIIWKSSVDKQMYQKVDLVMADGIKRMAPPKVNASEIVMSNPKTEEKEGDKNGNAKQQKHNEAFK